MHRTRLSLVVLAAAVMSACTVGPNYRPPEVAAPAAFAAAATQPAAKVDPARWWESINDPQLTALVRRVAADNLSVKAAFARLEQARAIEFVVSGGTLPYLAASGSAARGSGTNSTRGRVGPALNAGTNTAGLKEITHVVGFDAGWEIDLFGRFRRQLEAAAADTQAAAEARHGVLITVIADTVRAYIELRAYQGRVSLAQENITRAARTLELVQERFRRGLTNELDVTLARRQFAALQAALAPLQAQVLQAQRRIAVLVGESPAALQAQLTPPGPIPALPEKILAGLPLDTIRRRPDLRQLERQLAAETARIGVATADLFPRVAITAGLGLQGQGLGRAPVVNDLLWSAGPTAIVPLLDFGRIESLIELENLRAKELLYAYRQTVLSALEQVDDALSNYAAQRRRAGHLAEAVDASRRAFDLATGRYDRGLVDFLNVLDAQRQMYELQDQYTLAQEAASVEYVALFKALGGGWENFTQEPNVRQPLPAVFAATRELTK